jgi:hypothetical protein
MEMRRVVIVKEHLNDDSKETADLRHGRARGTRLGKLLLISFP